MAGILGNDGSLTSKAQELAAAITGEAPTKGGVADEQILLHDFKLRGIDPKIGLTAALQELKSGLKMYRKGNSIVAVKKLDPNTAQMHFFTLDKEEEFRHWVKFWVDEFRKLGGRVIYDTVADPHIIRALQAIGAHIQPSNTPKFKMMAMV